VYILESVQMDTSVLVGPPPMCLMPTQFLVEGMHSYTPTTHITHFWDHRLCNLITNQQ